MLLTVRRVVVISLTSLLRLYIYSRHRGRIVSVRWPYCTSAALDSITPLSGYQSTWEKAIVKNIRPQNVTRGWLGIHQMTFIRKILYETWIHLSVTFWRRRRLFNQTPRITFTITTTYTISLPNHNYLPCQHVRDSLASQLSNTIQRWPLFRSLENLLTPERCRKQFQIRPRKDFRRDRRVQTPQDRDQSSRVGELCDRAMGCAGLFR